jgi:phage baseplate assembly protein V
MNPHVAAATEHDRMLGNVLMIGVVSALDAANAVVQVEVNGFTTDWIPWAARRAGPNTSWSAPEVGEQVLIGCPYGDPSQAVVLCCLYQTAYPAPATTADKERVTFSDGASVEYDRSTHTLTVDTVNSQGVVNIICKQATVTASTSITFDTPNAKFTGNLEVDGNTEMKGNADVQGSTTVKAITSNGMNISDSHKHGNGNQGQPTTAVIG